MTTATLNPPRTRDAAWFDTLQRTVNADAEMAVIGHYFNANIAFTFGDERHDLIVQKGRITDVRHGQKLDWRTDFGFRASPETWDKFFASPPPPLYNSVFAMIMRVPDFRLEGDTLALAQNARAVTRLLNIMQTQGQRA